MTLVEELREALGDMGISIVPKEEEAALRQCAELCEMYDVLPDDFVMEWVAYAASKAYSELSSSYLSQFEKDKLLKLKKDSTNQNKSKQPAKPSKAKPANVVQVYGSTEDDMMDISEGGNRISDDDIDDFLEVYGEAAAVFKRKSTSNRFDASRRRSTALKKSPQVGISPAGYKGYSPAIQATSEKYGSRTKSGDVVFRYKCKDSDFWETKEEKSEWNVEALSPSLDFIQKVENKEFKYMFQKIKEVTLAMSFLMEDTSKQIFDELTEDSPSRGSLQHSSTNELTYLGRIRSDGKLTSGSVFFEGCLDYSDGHIVDLDLSAIDDYHVFPGQTLVIEGKNDLGKCLRVSKIHVPKPISFKDINIRPHQVPLKLNLMVAVGPYTPSDSLQYEALTDIITVVKRDRPEICVLIGPFVEATHKMIENGDVAETFNYMFEKQMDFVIKASENLKTQFVLVPSYKDVMGQLVYPTPPYVVKQSEKVTVVPDPATFSVRGVVIGVTSTDILMHLGKNELANSTISTDRMGRLARHILSQRNFYPLYPCDESLPLDVEHWIKYGSISTNPHILILPSDLRHFIKDVDGTIVVNPERLVKSSSGGTYARLQVDLSSASPGQTFSSISDFCVGEIVKI